MINEILLESQSAAASATTVPLEIGDYLNYSIVVEFTGSNVAGDLYLEASINGTTYFTVDGTPQSVSNSEDHMWNVRDAGYRYVRCVWTYTSGTGNIVVRAMVKQPIVRITGA